MFEVASSNKIMNGYYVFHGVDTSGLVISASSCIVLFPSFCSLFLNIFVYVFHSFLS